MPISSPVYRDCPFAVVSVPGPDAAAQQLIWGHGWGQSSTSLLPLAESLKAIAPSLLIDFPGFGESPMPDATWGTGEYADQVADWLHSFKGRRTIWIGHSFGGRVGLQLAARYPDLVAGMVLIAAAGLPRKRSRWQTLEGSVRRRLVGTAKRFFKDGPQIEALRTRMGSADYRSAGALRPIFVRVVNEDLTALAREVRCPALLLYGKEDTETPPEMGARLQALMGSAELIELDGLGHLNILTTGRHQVASKIRKFLESLP